MTDPLYDSPDSPWKQDRLECRQCGVICERVVFPVRCLRSSCRYVYAFLDDLGTYFGCLEGVFAAELMLAPFQSNPGKDVFGALKVSGSPRSECSVKIEMGYGYKYSWVGCSNPIFLQHPEQYAPETIRSMVEGPSDAAA